MCSKINLARYIFPGLFLSLPQAFYFAATVSVSYFVSVLVALAIEFPFANLEKVILPAPKRSKKVEECPPESAADQIVTVVQPPADCEVTFRGSAHVNGVDDVKE